MQQTARGNDDRSKDQRSEPQAGALPNQAFDLRSTLEWLRASGELIETDKEVDPDLQVTGLQKHMDGGCPVLFNTVKGKPNHRVITNLFGDMAIINRMFGWKDDAERVRKLAYALSHPIPPVEIPQNEAPCQEHVIENPRDVNEWMVPIRHTTYEPELTVGSGIRCVTGPQFEGGSDLGYNRMNFRWGNVGTFQISPGSHMWQVANKYYKEDQPVPASTTRSCRWAATRSASPRRCRARRCGSSRRAPSTPWRWPTAKWCWKATSIRATAASRPRRPKRPACKAAIISTRNGPAIWASPTRRRPSTSPPSPCASRRANRSSSRSACICSTTTISTPPCARRRSTNYAIACSRASCRTW